MSDELKDFQSSLNWLKDNYLEERSFCVYYTNKEGCDDYICIMLDYDVNTYQVSNFEIETFEDCIINTIDEWIDDVDLCRCVPEKALINWFLAFQSLYKVIKYETN